MMEVKDGFSLKGEVRVVTTKNGKLVRDTGWMQNKIVLSAGRGLSIVLDRLAGTNDYTLNVTHLAMGTDGTPATSADTGLGNETVRVGGGVPSRASNTVSFRFFFPDGTTPDDEYHEMGLYIDGTGTLASGRIWNRIASASPLITKGPGEDNTVLVRITGNV